MHPVRSLSIAALLALSLAGGPPHSSAATEAPAVAPVDSEEGGARRAVLATPIVGGLQQPADSVPALFAGPDGAAALATAVSPGGSLAELSGIPRQQAAPVRARHGAQDSFDRPHPEEPGPGGWSVLACAIAALLFMARRKLAVTGP